MAFSATFFFAVLFIFLLILIAGSTLNYSSDVYVKPQGYITGNKVGKRGGRYNERMSKMEILIGNIIKWLICMV